MSAKLRKGDQFKLTADAIENYGEKYEGQVFTVSHVATKYMPAAQFYAKGSPSGFHPGYDEGVSGQGLYDAEGLPFSVYDWEVRRV